MSLVFCVLAKDCVLLPPQLCHINETRNQPPRDQAGVRIRDVDDRADAHGDVGEDDECESFGATQPE